ncbi:MAG: hypothetical protein ACOC6B_07115 [Thermodesulfobacteriota bacterium]
MTKAPAFQLYAADFYMDTVGWDVWEVGAYLRLLLYEWINGAIPNDTEVIASIIGEPIPGKSKRYNAKRERFLCDFRVKIERNLLKKFHDNGADSLINHRLEEERAKQNKYRESLRESGRKGAKRRWEKDSHPNNNPNGNPNGVSMALQSSSSYNKGTTTTPSHSSRPSAPQPNEPSSSYSYEKLIQKTDNLCQTLGTFFHKPKAIYQWRQQAMKNNLPPELIELCLGELWKYRHDKNSPIGYLNKLMQIKWQNKNEAEAIAKHESLRLEEKEYERFIRGRDP